MSAKSSFRGYWSILEVTQRMLRLRDQNRAFRPDIKHMTLEKKDFDLIKRWPKAAEANQITITDRGVYWEGFELREKAGLGRYEKPHIEQAEITSPLRISNARLASFPIATGRHLRISTRISGGAAMRQ